uniref:Uncharacterized protein n=1 Tax=Cucumis melo TaxID=3656 RepID=A0A9I9E579_CUCME
MLKLFSTTLLQTSYSNWALPHSKSLVPYGVSILNFTNSNTLFLPFKPCFSTPRSNNPRTIKSKIGF